jgi:ABC-type antimicrobial peptide transport system permease subunit
MMRRSAFAQLGLGLAIGVPVALARGLLLADQLYGVNNYDPLLVALAALVLVASALLAALLPARRAMRVDPILALRYE